LGLVVLAAVPSSTGATELPGFQTSLWFDEQVDEQRFEPDSEANDGAAISAAATPTPLVIPSRPPTAVGGAEFMATLSSLDLVAREASIVKAITSGNLPQHLRTLQTIRVSVDSADGLTREVIYRVMPDYLSVGHDDDFVRIPMTPQSAQTIADQFGCTLPTCRMVDQIYQQAAVKLAPRPLTANPQTPGTFVKHNSIIGQQQAAAPLGQLVAGIKKDLVISNRLAERPRRVALFGWHRRNGQPIQPLSIVHVDTYVDYSHGVRLIQRELLVDGKAMTFAALLQDENLSALVSDEGVILQPRYGPRAAGVID